MAKINGNAVLVFVNDVAIGCLTGCSMSVDLDEVITTCKDNDGAKTSLPGGVNWGIDFDGNFDTSATVGLSQLLDIVLGKTLISVRFGLDTSGGLYLTGSAYLSSVKWEGPLNAASKFTGKVIPASALTKGTHT